MSKKSVRFFNNLEVRSVWNHENSLLVVFGYRCGANAINDEPDYTESGNYWRWLKHKMTQVGVQLVSATHGFKFEALDKINDVVLSS